jgi:uncharacterized protein YeaO (DUF488 family)
MIKIKRVYEVVESDDGFRILVDRLWPRGLTKEKAQVDLWLRDIAPSTELRTWFGHDPAKWDEFKKRYTEELRRNTDVVLQLTDQIKNGTVTIVYGAKDTKHNDAVVLKEFIEKK